MATKKNTPTEDKVSNLDKMKNFFGTVTENVIEGATIVTEAIKDNSAKAYVASAEIVEDANDKIHTYSDKILLQKEIKNMESRQVQLMNEFGAITIEHYVNSDSLHKAFLTTKAVSTIVEEYKENKSKIVLIEKKLKKISN